MHPMDAHTAHTTITQRDRDIAAMLLPCKWKAELIRFTNTREISVIKHFQFWDEIEREFSQDVTPPQRAGNGFNTTLLR